MAGASTTTNALTDSDLLDWIEENCAEVEMLCDGSWRVSAYGEYEDKTLRGAIIKAVRSDE